MIYVARTADWIYIWGMGSQGRPTYKRNADMDLTKEAIAKRIAAAPYRLMVDGRYSGRPEAVAHGSKQDMVELAAVTDPRFNPKVERNN